MRIAPPLLLSLAICSWLVGVAPSSIASPQESKPANPCECVVGRLENGWCKPCRVGYVAGFPMKSPMLWEALDAHGHDIDPQKIECANCQKQMTQDGFCEPCKWGFVGGQLYFSRLTYLLAQGSPQSSYSCKSCETSSKDHGWCQACAVGMIGNVRIPDQKVYLAAIPQLQKLKAAIAMLKECHFCAAALFLDGRCHKCRVQYRDGKPTAARKGKSRSGSEREAAPPKPDPKPPHPSPKPTPAPKPTPKPDGAPRR